MYIDHVDENSFSICINKISGEKLKVQDQGDSDE